MNIAYLGTIDEVDHNLVVEEFNRLPLNALAGVLVLLRTQHLFDEYLLQLLVDVIDTQLFKTVALEYFKPVDVQHADIQPLATAVLRLHNGALCRFKSIVDHGDEPLEQLVVKRLC